MPFFSTRPSPTKKIKDISSESNHSTTIELFNKQVDNIITAKLTVTSKTQTYIHYWLVLITIHKVQSNDIQLVIKIVRPIQFNLLLRLC